MTEDSSHAGTRTAIKPGSLMLGVPAKRVPAAIDLDATIAKYVADYDGIRPMYQGEPAGMQEVEAERFS